MRLQHNWQYILVLLMVVCLFMPGPALAEKPQGLVEDPLKNNISPLPDLELGKYQYCGEDADCVKAVNGCCDCANGGADVAINKRYVEDFKGRFQCLHVTCTMRAAIPPCGSGVVSCVNHKCKYLEPQDANF